MIFRIQDSHYKILKSNKSKRRIPIESITKFLDTLIPCQKKIIVNILSNTKNPSFSFRELSSDIYE